MRHGFYDDLLTDCSSGWWDDPSTAVKDGPKKRARAEEVPKFPSLELPRKSVHFWRVIVLEAGFSYYISTSGSSPLRLSELLLQTLLGDELRTIRVRDDWLDSPIHVGDVLHLIGDFDESGSAVVDREVMVWWLLVPSALTTRAAKLSGGESGSLGASDVDWRCGIVSATLRFVREAQNCDRRGGNGAGIGRARAVRGLSRGQRLFRAVFQCQGCRDGPNVCRSAVSFSLVVSLC